MIKVSHSLFALLCLTASCSGRTFKLGLLTPWQPDYEFSGYTSAAAVSIAIEKVHADPNLNADGKIQLSVISRDSGCNSKQTGGTMVDMIYNHSIDAVIGPPCSSAARSSAELTSFFKIPMVSWVATAPDLNDKITYSSLARTFPPFSKMGLFLMEIFKQYNWKRVAIFGYSSLLWGDTGRAIKLSFEENNITIALYKLYDQNPSDEFIMETMEKMKLTARIILLISPTEDRRRMMLAAFDLGMCDGDYVFYTLESLPDENNLEAEAIWKGNDGRDWQARKAFEAVFHVSLAALSGTDVNIFRLEVARRMRLPPWSDFLPTTMKEDSYGLGDKYSPFLHDAVLLYAIALNETIRKGQSVDDSMEVVRNMRAKFYKGMTGNVVLDALGDREPDYWITDMDPRDGSFVKIAEVLNLDDGGRLFNKNVRPPHWPRGIVGHEFAPPDTPKCGFLNEFCKDSGLATWVIIVIVISVVIIIAGAVIISLVLYRATMFENDLLVQSWRLADDEIEPVKGRKGGSERSVNSDNSGSDSSSKSSSLKGSQGKSVSSMWTLTQQIFTDVGYHKGVLVSLKKSRTQHQQISRKIQLEFNELKYILHENLNVFVGAVVDPPNISLVWHYCPKGSIQDVVMNDSIKLDDMFKLSFLTDIVKGMSFLHTSKLHSHGNLKSSNCLVDARWNVKITDYGLPSFYSDQAKDEDENQQFKRKLWTSPELLREHFPNPKGSQKGDVYSFAIICFETIMRSEPYTFETMTPRDAVNRVRNGESIPFRPPLPESHELGRPLLTLVRSCWSETTDTRPTFLQLRAQLRKITGGDISIMANIMQMMDKYAANLEEIVEERTGQVVEEKLKTDRLLYKMLPVSVAEALKAGTFVKPEMYEQSSIYFSDIVGFTAIASDSSPMQIVDFLNDLYTCFDEIISTHDVYKVETIGDAYMVVSGVPVRNGIRHAGEIANTALDLLSAVTSFKIRHRPHQQLQLRIGLHSGAVVSGVVGLIMPRYCLFGDVVQFATKMESSGKPLRIHISKMFFDFLKEIGAGHECTYRGEMNIKGKGLQKTYWLHGRKGFDKPLPTFDKDDD